MNVYVSVDIEGITGVVHARYDDARPAGIRPGPAADDRRMRTPPSRGSCRRARTLSSSTTGTARCATCSSRRCIRRRTSSPAPATRRITARSRWRTAGISTAAVFVGYHAMARTPKAIHPHTIAGAVVSELRINGRPHGETGINAAVLGAMGIPVVMVTGDTTTVAEARDFLGGRDRDGRSEGSVGRNAALCRPPSATRPEITAAAARALAKRDRVPPYMPDRPFQLEVDFLTMVQCDRAARTAGIERLGPIDDPRARRQSVGSVCRPLGRPALRALLSLPRSSRNLDRVRIAVSEIWGARRSQRNAAQCPLMSSAGRSVAQSSRAFARMTEERHRA